jgi:8-oxo-dGTP pyrophosphatase MutT (NUDIX family)
MPIKHLDLVANPSICTSVFLFNQGKVLYGLRHYSKKEYKNATLWTTPGGRCDAGETIEANIRRETTEETRIRFIRVLRFLGIVPGAKEGDTLYCYLGSTPEQPQLAEPEKFSEWRWFEPKATPENFINPEALRLLLQFLGS